MIEELDNPTTASTAEHVVTLGEILFQARNERSLERIARELKVSPEALMAIEANDYEHLKCLYPANVFIRGHVIRYAEYLGLSLEQIAPYLEHLDLPLHEHALQQSKIPVYGKSSYSTQCRWLMLLVSIALGLLCFSWYQQGAVARAQNFSKQLLRKAHLHHTIKDVVVPIKVSS